MPSPGGQFFSDEFGDIEDYFISDYQLIDQYIGDQLWTWGYNLYGQLGINATTNRTTPVTTFSGGTNWKSVAGGERHTAAIKTDGTLWVWGDNSTGQIGINTTTNRTTPVTTILGGTDWKFVAGGGYHIAAIKTDGTLWTWGWNNEGQLGINDTTNRSTPVTTFAGGTNWKSFSFGERHTAAIKTDGTLWTWGFNNAGQIGINTTTNRTTPVTTFAGGTDWKSVAGGDFFTAAIKTDGTLWAWGRNAEGQLGNNFGGSTSTPVTTFLGGTYWKSVACGDGHTLAIKTDGTLWNWGRNGQGQLGINDTNDRSTPVTTILGGTNWKSVSAGYRHTLAIKTDGTLWTWGSNTQGQLGINDTNDRSTPVTTILGGTNWKSVAGGERHTLAIQSGLNVDFSYLLPIIRDGLILYLDASDRGSYPGSGTTWTDISGNGKNGTLTNGPTFSSSNGGSIVFDGVDDYVSSVSNLTLDGLFSISLWVKHNNTAPVQERYISLGSDRIVIQENENADLNLYVTDGTQQNLWTWGFNDRGQLGINDTTNRSTPVTTILGGTNWRLVSSGDRHIAAIKTDGTLWTWGWNNEGQLGINDANGRTTPVTTFAGGTDWKSVSNGERYTLAIKTDGTLWVWGLNDNGQIGINTTTNRSTPVTTFAGGTNWKSAAGGDGHVAAIKTDGTLWTWSFNNGGQLGVNDTTSRSTPVTTILGGTNWKSVACGYGWTLAIKTDGTLWTWGSNANGRLGINDTTNRSTPVTTFAGGTNWKSAAGGDGHVAAIKTDGTLWTWSFNNGGQLGVNDTTSRSTPVTTFAGGTNWKSVDTGDGHTVAIKTDGTLWLWGRNNEGHLGINNSTNRSTPVTTILGGNNWKSVAGGENHTIAIKTDGTFINDISSNNTLSNNTFYNIVATSDGITLKLYQNTALVSTATLGGTLSSTSLSYTLSSAFEALSGNLYNVLVYNKALTAVEVNQNFDAFRGYFGV